MYHHAIDTKSSILDDVASKVCCALVITESFILSFHSLFYKNNNTDFKRGGSGRHENPDDSDTWNEINQEVSEWMAAWRNQHKRINKKRLAIKDARQTERMGSGLIKWTLFTATTTQRATGGRISASTFSHDVAGNQADGQSSVT